MGKVSVTRVESCYAGFQELTKEKNMFGSLLKAVVGTVVETPVALVADVLTLGGAITDKKEPYTATAIRKVVQNIEDASDPRL